jgi:hypothetical protein
MTLPAHKWSRVQDHLNAMGGAQYSLDLLPCNFHVFRPLEKALIAHIFRSGNDFQEAMV